jgi:hypothetical protein
MNFNGREPLFFLRILLFHNMHVKLSMVECNGKRSSPKGLRGRPGDQEVWPAGHTLPPKILGFYPNFPYKSLNSFLPLNLEIRKESFEKGNPNLWITMIFRLRKHVDVILLT